MTSASWEVERMQSQTGSIGQARGRVGPQVKESARNSGNVLVTNGSVSGIDQVLDDLTDELGCPNLIHLCCSMTLSIDPSEQVRVYLWWTVLPHDMITSAPGLVNTRPSFCKHLPESVWWALDASPVSVNSSPGFTTMASDIPPRRRSPQTLYKDVVQVSARHPC